MIIEKFFPTLVYGKDVQLNNNQLAQDIVNWSNQDKGVSKTNVKGWHSTTDMHTKSEYSQLVTELTRMQKEIYDNEHIDRHAVLGNMWANINPPGGMNRAHQHPNSLWSGVYWIKTPKNCGQLKIDDPRSAACMTRPRQKDVNKPDRLWRETHYEPIAGRVIMFPSWLMHCVDPNNSNEIRISISFNFLQKCMFV